MSIPQQHNRTPSVPAQSSHTPSSHLPSIDIPINPTAQPRTFSNFGSKASKQFNRAFNSNFAQSLAPVAKIKAIQNAAFDNHVKNYRSRIEGLKQSDITKKLLKDNQELKFSSERAGYITAQKHTAANEAKALLEVRKNQWLKSQKKFDDFKKAGASHEVLKDAALARNLAEKKFLSQEQTHAKLKRQALSQGNVSKTARETWNNHSDFISSLGRLQNTAVASQLRALKAQTSNRTAARVAQQQLNSGIRKTMSFVGDRAIKSIQTNAPLLARTINRGTSRVLSRAVSAPFRGNGRSRMVGIGRNDGRNYNAGLRAATRGIQTRLLTGRLPTVTGMAGILRGTMVDADRVGRTSGNLFSKAFAGTMGVIKTGLAAATVGTALIGGSILKGGISRALNLEDAQAKLKGIGYTAEGIKGVTDSALGAVLNTKFSLDQAMSMSASALAAGIKPGKELTKYLQLIADTATIAGTDFQDMAVLFNKIQAGVKVEARELNQVSTRGIPIFQWLADYYNVSVTELRKMVRAGKVYATDFRAVIDQHLAGAALKSAETTRGAFTNMRIAWARFGALVVGGALPAVRQLFVENQKLADFMGQRFGPTLTAFWEKWGPRATQEIADWGATIQKFLEGGYDSSTTVIAIKKVIDALKALAHNVFMLEPIQFFWKKLMSVFKNDDGSVKSFKQFGQDIIDTSQGFGKAVKDVYDWMMGSTADPDNLINLAWRNLLDLFNELKPALKDLMPILGDLAKQLGSALGDTLKQLMPALVKELPNLGTALAIAMEKAGPVIAEMLPKLPGLITDLANGAIVFIEKLIPFLVEFLPKLLDLIGKIGELLVVVLPPLVDFLTGPMGGFGLALILALLLGINAEFALIAVAIIAAAIVVYGIVMSIASLIADIGALFTTGKFGANFASFISHSFGLGPINNPDGKDTSFAQAIGAADGNTQRQDAVGAAYNGLKDPTANPYQQYNTYNMNVTNHTDVDAQRNLEDLQKLMQNKPGGK